MSDHAAFLISMGLLFGSGFIALAIAQMSKVIEGRPNNNFTLDGNYRISLGRGEPPAGQP